jgi:hypothetical protein
MSSHLNNNKSLKYEKENIELRRGKVLELDAQGYSQHDIAAKLNVSVGLVNGDLKNIREHDRPGFNAMIDRVWEIKKQLGNIWIYCDAANPVIWQDLKKEFGETYSNKYVFDKLAEYEKRNLNPANDMRIIPVPFSTQGAAMLQHAKSLVENPEGLIAIDKRFDKLLTALRTAVANEYKLKKEETSYHDILDAFRLALQFFRRNK